MREKIIIALDVSSRQQALQLVKQTRDFAGMFKVGLQLYSAAGPSIVRELAENGCRIFLDLKFHDIPTTVTKAVLEAAKLGASMMTVHASGGRVMMESAADVLQNEYGDRKPLIVAVTVLTSLDTRALFELGLEYPADQQVERLARLAEDCGMGGVVCSPREILLLRKIVQPQFKIVTPGIRLPDQSSNDQQRTATPEEAIAAGADYIVVGRAVTNDVDPGAALQRLIAGV
jgi:orotidine-5'-phosphate decarboxylase